MKRENKGLFITFEGGEGAGKTTLINRIYETLIEKKFQVLKTLEPGGTPLGIDIRKLLLYQEVYPISKRCELFLYLADRSHHVEKVILPALKEGKVVLCDRFNDSTLAYQGVARRFDLKLLQVLCLTAAYQLVPDLTLYLDLDPKIGLERARKLNTFDRLEKENLAFHAEVRKGFLSFAKKEPERFHVIDAEQDVEDVYQKAVTKIESVL